MDDEFAKFMAEVAEPEPPKILPKKRGLPSAYMNRPGMFESVEAKTRRIEEQVVKVDFFLKPSSFLKNIFCLSRSYLI